MLGRDHYHESQQPWSHPFQILTPFALVVIISYVRVPYPFLFFFLFFLFSQVERTADELRSKVRSAKEIASERLQSAVQTKWKTAARRASASARGRSGGAYTRELFRAARAERAECEAFAAEYGPDTYPDSESGPDTYRDTYPDSDPDNHRDYSEEQHATEPLEGLIDAYSLSGDGAAGAWDGLPGAQRTPGVVIAGECSLYTVTYSANRAHNLTRSP